MRPTWWIWLLIASLAGCGGQDEQPSPSAETIALAPNVAIGGLRFHCPPEWYRSTILWPANAEIAAILSLTEESFLFHCAQEDPHYMDPDFNASLLVLGLGLAVDSSVRAPEVGRYFVEALSVGERTLIEESSRSLGGVPFIGFTFQHPSSSLRERLFVGRLEDWLVCLYTTHAEESQKERLDALLQSFRWDSVTSP
jgi:hypothetical protein